MEFKDYYSILELPPSASGDEIKKAFRRLAHQHHPDKRNNDPSATAQFATIKEAYEILSHPLKKEYYLQQRWYAQSMGVKLKQETITPVSILKLSLELNRYVARLDIHRMDKQGLFNYIENNLLADATIDTLNSFNEPAVCREIVSLLLKCGNVLPYHLAKPLAELLNKIKTADHIITKQIDQFIRHHKQIAYWEKRKIWIILLITLLICLGIFFISNNN